MNNLEQQVEAILFFTGEAVPIIELARLCDVSTDAIETAYESLAEALKTRGVSVLRNGDTLQLTTHGNVAPLVERLREEELSKDLGKATLETLAIIVYKAPVSKREIDHIRGVNSSYMLRNLMIRGLVERKSARGQEKGYVYAPTTELLGYLGITDTRTLPDQERILKELEVFSTNNGESTE